jgi:hypothetical protein
MNALLIWVGRIAGLLGFAMAAVSVGARMTGMWRVGELAVGTLLLGAVAAMVLGALAYTAAIAERGPR